VEWAAQVVTSIRGRVLAGIALAVASLWSHDSSAADPTAVEWSDDWPKVHVWEIAAAAALTIGDTEVEKALPLPSKATWRGGILFDDWARDTFRGRTAQLQSDASTLSDIFYKAGALVPFVMDDYFAAASIHENAGVGLQLVVIDLESLGFAGLISLGAEHAVGRARPYTEDCGSSGVVKDGAGHVLHQCGSGNDFRSFYSGHATATATVAGLVCVHHQHLPLFGGGFADLAPCLGMIGVSVAAGLLRLVYDEHWASDVIVGWMDGAFSGYVLPSLLHFGFGSGKPIAEVRAGNLDMIPTLRPYPGGAGLGLVGTF
jgi:hypothetical protein